MIYFLVSLGCLLILLLIIRYWLLNSEPILPNNIDDLIHEVINADLPELMPGQKGFAQNGNIKIAFEVLQPNQPIKGTFLMTNGHTQTMLEWQPYFIQPFLDAGYQVIRYDNRGFGMSDWVKNWNEKGNKYNLSDMASDGIAILDHLKIEKAHALGNSMGGMISQAMAINYPERILSVTSIMSTGYYYDPKLTAIPKPFVRNLFKILFRYKRRLNQLEVKLKYQYSIRQILKGKGNYTLDTKSLLQQFYYEIKMRNGYNPKAHFQHGYAIKKSGSRYEDLKKLTIPVLVVHGTDDTLILLEHAKKYGEMIPNANLLILEGMGHDIPKEYSSSIIKANFEMIEKSSQLAH